MLEYLKVRLAGKVLDLVPTRLQSPINENGHGVIVWGGGHDCRKRSGTWAHMELRPPFMWTRHVFLARFRGILNDLLCFDGMTIPPPEKVR